MTSSHTAKDAILSAGPMADLHILVNTALKQAIANERSKKWRKVLNSYRVVVELLQRFTKSWSERDRPGWLKMLLYEIHFHTGIALQRMNLHRKAVGQFTKSLESIYVYRGGCRVSTCHSNSCLMTPVYTRRALAHCQTGSMSEALKDAEAAVVMDTRNPDVYCVRSLVRSARKEFKEAMNDAQRGLDFNSNHICSLIIYGHLLNTCSENHIHETSSSTKRPNQSPSMSKHHLKACNLNPDCFNYLTVGSFTHPDIMTFYDRFLFSLNVAHTIFEVQTDPTLNTYQSERRVHRHGNDDIVDIGHETQPEIDTHNSRVTTASSQTWATMADVNLQDNSSTAERTWSSTMSKTPAETRCRTNASTPPTDDVTTVSRRAISAPNFLAGTCNSYRVASSTSYRPVRPGSSPQSSSSQGVERNPSVLELRRTYSALLRHRQTLADNEGELRSSDYSKMWHSKSIHHEATFSISSKHVHSTKINIQHIPRMYYKPWLGDKLPVNDTQRAANASSHSSTTEPFKV